MNKYRAHSRRAQKALRRHRSCERKVRYGTEAEAAHQWTQRIYLCGYCGGWHRSASLAKLVAKVSRKPAPGGEAAR